MNCIGSRDNLMGNFGSHNSAKCVVGMAKML
jgi:hypothetical protein